MQLFKSIGNNFTLISYHIYTWLFKFFVLFMATMPLRNQMNAFFHNRTIGDYEKWKFDHPYPQDMFDALQEKIDVDITWYFKQYFYENKVFDYDVEMIGYSPVDEANFVPLARIQVLDSAEMNSDELFLNRFRIVNHGDGWFPMDLVVTMEDGTEITDLKWDHKASFNIVDFYASKRIESVQLDPERKAIIELNFHNNGRTMKPVSATAKYVNRWMYWIQNLSQFLIGF